MIDIEVKVVPEFFCVRSVIFCKLRLHLGAQRGPLVRNQRFDQAAIHSPYESHERMAQSPNAVSGPETLAPIEVLESDRICEPNQPNSYFRIDPLI